MIESRINNVTDISKKDLTRGDIKSLSDRSLMNFSLSHHILEYPTDYGHDTFLSALNNL